MFIHGWDEPLDDHEWRAFLDAHPFGELVAAGRHRDVAVVAPTQFVIDGDEVLVHLLAANPIWPALVENPAVVLAVSGDWAFIPSAWKAMGDEDPARGIPTTYYASVQLTGRARLLDQPDDVAGVLRTQLGVLQPEVPVVDPAEHGAKLRAIRAARISIEAVRAKFKYGSNVDQAHRQVVADHLVDRLAEGGRAGDAAALAHLQARIDPR